MGCMFERYTEKARRTIFFARYEASQFGSPYIETEHLLLGWLREDKALANRLIASREAAQSIRKRIEELTPARKKVSTSVDLPLSNEGKRVLAYAAEEAERLSHKNIGTEHLLLGLLREERGMAASVLRDVGVDLEKARETIAKFESELAGAVEAAGGTRGRSIEFVCGKNVVASVAVNAASHIPRVGERVVFKNKDGEDERYRVENVTYTYDGHPAELAAAHQLAKVVIEVELE